MLFPPHPISSFHPSFHIDLLPFIAILLRKLWIKGSILCIKGKWNCLSTKRKWNCKFGPVIGMYVDVAWYVCIHSLIMVAKPIGKKKGKKEQGRVNGSYKKINKIEAWNWQERDLSNPMIEGLRRWSNIFASYYAH